MGDSLRVLGLCMGRLWFKEMIVEIEAFRKTLGREKEVDEKSLKEAIKRLIDMGLVEAEGKIRATYTGGEPDVLVGLRDYVSTIHMLRKDPDYLRYLEVMESFLGSR